ncbi:MAG: hypothetical protein IK048_03675 [Clostridia bacterium]|nr:hypothetical protein [Clostridia bacterium]
MKKRIVVFVLVVALIAVVASCLVACNMFKEIKLDEVKANLENAGYEVIVMSGSEYCNSDKNEHNLYETDLNTYLEAHKGGDKIFIFFFTDTSTASRQKEFMFNFDADATYDGQSNEVVYYATKQARKDAGLG